MSATNRGSKRIESDRYYTPENVIHKFLDAYELDMNGLTILEPSSGEGSFCKVIKERYPSSFIVANEINQNIHSNLVKYSDMIYNYDFLQMEHTEYYDIIISNPPFSIALPFIEKCFEIAQVNTTIIMLLRTAFLESKSRYDFWQKHPLSGLYTLSSRPSFTGKGTDNCSYSFFVWENSSHKQEIKVI